VVATLVCAGNRRAELLNVHPIPGKDPWAHGAISTAEWRGARLADVLHAAGVHPGEGLHVAFAAPDVAQEAVPVQSVLRQFHPVAKGPVGRSTAGPGR
jgi:sulfite oxidase